MLLRPRRPALTCRRLGMLRLLALLWRPLSLLLLLLLLLVLLLPLLELLFLVLLHMVCHKLPRVDSAWRRNHLRLWSFPFELRMELRLVVLHCGRRHLEVAVWRGLERRDRLVNGHGQSVVGCRLAHCLLYRG